MEINFKKLNFLVEPKNYQSFWSNFSNWEQDDLNFVKNIRNNFLDLMIYI